jgi:hypothetical protein
MNTGLGSYIFIQAIESNLPTSKTMSLPRYLEHIASNGQSFLERKTFYNRDFNTFKLYGYGGKQQAMSEVYIYTLLISRFPNGLHLLVAYTRS